jgi:hypothetical protein
MGVLGVKGPKSLYKSDGATIPSKLRDPEDLRTLENQVLKKTGIKITLTCKQFKDAIWTMTCLIL